MTTAPYPPRPIQGQIDEATRAARRYQRGFHLRDLRNAPLGKPSVNVFGDRVCFALLGTGGKGDRGRGTCDSPDIKIIADLKSRRIWTDFVEGAGTTF